jgi:hypothetical protein
MSFFNSITLRQASVGAALALLAACAPPPPPPAPPPPPPPPPPVVVQEAIPYRPLPPGGADYAMIIPPLGPDGVRVTPNKNLNPDETLWYLRSGWNVAALNCLDPAFEPILEGYRGFLKKYAKKLTATNKALDAQYRKVAGTANAGIKRGRSSAGRARRSQ